MATIIKHRFEFHQKTLERFIPDSGEFCDKFFSMTGCATFLGELLNDARDTLVVYLPDNITVQPLLARLPNCYHTETVAGITSIQTYRSAPDVKTLLGSFLPC